MIWFKLFIPIVFIIIAIIIFGYSIRSHYWKTTGIISIVMTLVLSIAAFIQNIGNDASSIISAEKQSEEHEQILINQENLVQELSEIKAKIDSNYKVFSVNANKQPDDEITEWVVKNRNDVIYKDDIFFVDIKVRKDGDKEWSHATNADIGDTIEFQAEYVNLSRKAAENVMVRAVLPTNMEYVEGSAKLYNSNYPDGAKIIDDTVATSGINIGSYKYQGNSYVRFKTRITDVSLAEGNNQLMTWISITDNGEDLYYEASVYIEK